MSGTPDEDGRQVAGGAAAQARRVDTRVLELLVCPLTKTSLAYDAERGELVSRAARLAFPIRDGIPVMLPDEARALADDE
ncbi:MAG: Trm112 family protein [Hyphomicrobiaceae bacterium]